jgi:glycine oxidase
VEIKTHIDYIIVGQGLAGSALALQMLEAGKDFLVIDEFNGNTSSRIAAGLYNPVTGQNSVKTWLADELFPFLAGFYEHAEKLTGEKFFHPMNVYRPFGSIQEQNEWMGRSADAQYAMFIEKIFLKPDMEEVHDPFGGLLLKHCGYVDTKVYIEGVRQLLRSRNLLKDEVFDDDQLIPYADRIEYGGYSATAIIFCQGERGTENKFFKKLPVRPLKGETLTIKTEFKKHVILNRGVYMVPDGVSGQFRVGATYRLNDAKRETTEEGKRELTEKLSDLFRLRFEITGQDWGVRPTTNDRRPLLGNHPEHERLVIFNGLGTKGVSLAPYFSNVLFRWLEKSGTLPKEVILTRYK